ncbi:MAG: hypothetical protein D6733_04410 [Methanobacteriota archaeon]|nr:MAG: hypothetical protein D6733_04410 [Euryarchaeota archaeon]
MGLKVFLIGVGRAGCRIAHLFLTSQKENISGVLIDTDEADLAFLKYRYRILASEGMLSGEGAGKDLKLGVEALVADQYGIIEKITRIKEEVDCFFVVSALGGGTGGAAWVVLEELKKNFIEPVYYIGLLPSSEDLPVVTVNAARSLRETVKHCDAFFPIHMDSFKDTLRLKGSYSSVNNRIFTYFQPLFQIGEFRGRRDIGENAVDFSDLVKTLKGLSVIGLGGQNLEVEPSSDRPETVIMLTKKAMESTTLPVNLGDVQKALVVVLGDRRYLDFIGSIPARLWAEKKIGGREVRGGDMPLSKKGEVKVLTVLSEIRKSEEIVRLYQKSEILKGGELDLERLSEAAERIKEIGSGLAGLQRELGETYRELKGLVRRDGPP